MPSARDKCFKESVENLKDAGKLKKLNVQDQQRWVRDHETGIWSQSNEVWYKVIRLISRVRKLIKGGGDLPEGAPDGTRIPDMTVTPDGGKPIVIDNKFDGDDWQPGQKDDYNEINQQQNANPKATDLQLNSQVCKCDEDGSADPVEVPVQSPVPLPGFSPAPGVPAGAPAGVPAGVGEGVPAGIPLGEPIFVP